MRRLPDEKRMINRKFALRRKFTHHWLRRAGLLILPNASHFAFLQDPEFFNCAGRALSEANKARKPELLFCAETGRALQTKKGMFGRLLRRQPEFYNFEHNRCGVGHRDPDADGLDRQSGPGANPQTYHLLRLIAPPLIGYG